MSSRKSNEAFDALISKLTEMSGDNIDQIVVDAMIEANSELIVQFESYLLKHKRTGETVRDLMRDGKISNKGAGNITFYFGHDFDKTLSSALIPIYLAYGTTVNGKPRVKPDKALQNFMRNTIKETLHNKLSLYLADMVKNI